MKFSLSTILCAVLFSAAVPAAAGPMSLDSCRNIALEHNKDMKMRAVGIEKADFEKKSAFAAYLPSIDFAGGYMYNQKNLSVVGSDQLLPVKSFNPATGSYDFNIVKNPATGEPVMNPATGKPIPSEVAYLPKDALTFDVHNVFFGALTLTQPVYMGGKIQALNKITGYASELARAMKAGEAENVIYAVDGAYWQVVSLRAKYDLARSYVNLLDTLRRNVQSMLGQGVATRADMLSVDVKLNQANVDLTKVENGLTLSRMALAQLCGLPIDSPMELADEGRDAVPDLASVSDTRVDMAEVYDRRPDLKALELGIQIRHQQQRVTLSSMLPNIALTGMYSFSNPNMFNGFSKSFSGAFSVGAVVSIPIWHWGGSYNKYRAAKAEVKLAELELQDARELVELQVRQASFRMQESVKIYNTAVSNMASAEENLHTAQLAYREGVSTTDIVMEAQTAWLKAASERVDAMIDVEMCRAYLAKSTGTLAADNPY